MGGAPSPAEQSRSAPPSSSPAAEQSRPRGSPASSSPTGEKGGAGQIRRRQRLAGLELAAVLFFAAARSAGLELAKRGPWHVLELRLLKHAGRLHRLRQRASLLGRPRRGGPGRASSLRPSSPRSGPASAILAAVVLAGRPRAGPSSPRRPWSRSVGVRSCCRASHVGGEPGFASEERGGAFLRRGWRPRQNAYPVCVFCWRRFAFPKSTVATHFWVWVTLCVCCWRQP